MDFCVKKTLDHSLSDQITTEQQDVGTTVLEAPFEETKASSGTLGAPQLPRSAKTPPQKETSGATVGSVSPLQKNGSIVPDSVCSEKEIWHHFFGLFLSLVDLHPFSPFVQPAALLVPWLQGSGCCSDPRVVT